MENNDSLALLHGKETCVWSDSAYQGQSEVIHKYARKVRDMTNRRCRYRGQVDAVEKRKNRYKSSVRATVEHPFLILKKVFGFAKVRYRGMAQNTERLHVACALVNLFQLRRPLLRLAVT